VWFGSRSNRRSLTGARFKAALLLAAAGATGIGVYGMAMRWLS
jgi:hypothetical protein